MPKFRTVLATTALLAIAGAAQAAPVKVSFWHIFDSGDAQKFINEVISKFNAANPNIQVEGLGTNFWDYWTRLTTAQAAGIGPDVAMNDLGNVPARAAAGLIEPLDAYMKKSGVALNNFWPATYNIIRYKNKTYALPLETDVRVLYYNKEAFRAAGLDPNKPPKTIAELTQYADKLTTKDAGGRLTRIGFGPTLGNTAFYVYAWANGGEFAGKNGAITINTPKNVEALKWMVDRQTAYGRREMAAFTAGFGANENDPFIAGKVAMIVQNNTFAGNIRRYAPKMDWGVAPLPGRTSWSNGFSLEMSAKSPNKQAAWEFMNYLMSDAVQLEYAKRNSSMVGNLQAARHKDLMKDPVWATMVNAMTYSKFRPFSMEAPTWYDTQLQPEVDAALLGTKTPEQALKDAQAAYEDAVRRYNQTRR
ncbi:MAG TPA: ABC transporter substrate-binding protein [Deinococcales bacterium]|nr:ABC transporter substrate-binding protein [Deinococcales bacterium]